MMTEAPREAGRPLGHPHLCPGAGGREAGGAWTRRQSSLEGTDASPLIAHPAGCREVGGPSHTGIQSASFCTESLCLFL